MRRALSTLFTLCLITCSWATETDSLTMQSVDSVATPKHRNIINKVIDYFSESNKIKPRKKFDWSVLGGPHYSSETKLGIGLVAAGLYKHNLSDTVTPMSQVSLYSDFSTTGYYLVGVKGYHIFPADKYRINYKVYFYSQPNHYWGMGYANNRDDDNDAEYRRKQMKVDADFMIRLGRHVFVGPTGQFCLIMGNHVDAGDMWLWNEQAMKVKTYGLGFAMSYDTRDNISNAYKGTYIGVHQRFYPAFLQNKYAFSSTEITGNYYKQIWKGGVLATQIHGMFTYGDTPWTMMPTITGSNGLRGYYDGRYNDKCEIDATVELRQRVWRRHGAVLWVGAGNVFPRFSDIRWRHTLPNCGVGYRWEFKNRLNVRFDVGVGRGEKGFVFNINEAF